MELSSFSSNGGRAGCLREKCGRLCTLSRCFVAEHQSNPTGSVRCIYRCQYRFVDRDRGISYRCGDNCEDWYPHAEDELHFCHHHKECLGIDSIASDRLVEHFHATPIISESVRGVKDVGCITALRYVMAGKHSLCC